MSPIPRDAFLAVATITPQLKMHFPKEVAKLLELLGGGVVGFYRRSDGSIIVRKM